MSDPAVRFAYIYRYTTAHANIVFDAIINNDQLKEIFDQENIKIACVGGGPGSDLLGIYKYVLAIDNAPSMMFYLLDREDAWSESWSEVDLMTKSSLSSSTTFRHIDVCDKESWQVHKKFLNSDLFTFVYFFSEIFSSRKEATGFFQNLFKNAKKQARFLYIDFIDSDIDQWFDSLTAEAGLKTVWAGSPTFQLSNDEDKEALGKYYTKFDNPKLKASLSVRVMEK